ncbi:hypothetical protein SAMN05421753_10424 [Planctomicrobium piriforme]|uniref:Metallo-beta-lactamase superfamily protein n=2 Tax=Planctomicrobium piriforme TaxID=1576369 RepID=A0A1I3E044_9PLAN|nr:hypothetical protein SAMN05421753_10424 [Planctomicrobium piriforme]
MFPARNGDALLLTYDGAPQCSVLIDGGYKDTFDNHICPVLQAMAGRGACLDALVVTHIDADHITGILRLLELNGPFRSSNIIPIRLVLHNSFRNLPLDSDAEASFSKPDLELLHEIRSHGHRRPNEVDSEISASQGSTLASLLRAGDYNWNNGDGHESISSPNVIALPSNVTLTLLGPTITRLTALRDWWMAKIRRLGVAGMIGQMPLLEDVFEFMCENEPGIARLDKELASHANSTTVLQDIYEPDESVTNSSSISLLCETPNSRILLPGDCWAEDLESALSSGIDLAKPFDAIKISHHGSFHNTSPRLLRIIDSPRFFISTDGRKHGHPDIQVLKEIVDRPAEFERHLYFNYRTSASRFMASYSSKSGTPFIVHEEVDMPVLISG